MATKKKTAVKVVQSDEEPKGVYAWLPHQKTAVQEMRPYVTGEDLTGISVNAEDTPEAGGMIARNSDNHKDQWYIGKAFYEKNYALVLEPQAEMDMTVTSGPDLAAKVSDVEVVGGDMWRVLCKASSKSQGWMKSSKAMEVPGGCLVQVTTQQKNPDGSYAVAEALAFVPGVKLAADPRGGCKLSA